MHIRPCLLSDIPTATSLASQAFLNDALFAASNPHRNQYPQDFRASFAPRFRAHILARNCLALVAETDPGDKTADGTVSAGGEVVGIAFWVRDGDDGERRVNACDGVLLDLERILTTLLEYPRSWFLRKDRSTEPELQEAVGAAFEEAERTLWPPGAGGKWHLKLLVMHPAWQRRGVGRRLCEVGLERARSEGVPAMLESSTVGLGLYVSLGFRVVGELVVGGFRGPVLRWDP